MLTPSQLTVTPNVVPLMAPDYNFEGQNRWDGTLMAGKYTAGSTQTFDHTGRPKDSQSDHND